MNLALVASIAYGILTLVGGIVGYLKSRSQVSLISGMVTGLLLLLSAFLQLQGNTGGLLLARIVTLLLIAVFAVRFAKTRKVMPAGIMVISGAIAFALMWGSLEMGNYPQRSQKEKNDDTSSLPTHSL